MTTTKPTLETCVELIRAAQTATEHDRALNVAKAHGYTLLEIAIESRRLENAGGKATP